MKQQSFFKFYFYIGFIIFLLTNYEIIHTQPLYFDHYDNIYDQKAQNIVTQLCDVYHKIDDLQQQEYQLDITVEVIIMFIEMYQKIVEATVAYYLMPNSQVQYNLHDIIMQIITEHTIKIISFLGQKFIEFICNRQMSWQEKISYCACILSMIYIIKIGIEKLSISIKPEEVISDFAL